MKDFVREDVLVSQLPKGGATARHLRSSADVRAFSADAGLFPHSDRVGYRQWGKRALDIALVLLSAPVTVPVILLASLVLWMESGLPFYRQDRLGKNGRTFKILKLRTMVRDAEQQLEKILAANPEMRTEWDATQKLKNDPRITKVGGILRMSSLDELPQLWNVLTGDMSLVGPRPMMPDQLSLYGDPAHYFAMRPGATGLWQVSDRNESEFAKRWEFDTRYHIDHTFGADVKIIWKTVGVMLRRTGY